MEVVEEEKDLGVLSTNDLKASQQCTAACNKENRVLGMMNRTIVYKSKEVLLNMYKSLVRPCTCWILYTSVVTLLPERQNTDWESAASFHKDDSGILQAAILWKI